MLRLCEKKMSKVFLYEETLNWVVSLADKDIHQTVSLHISHFKIKFQFQVNTKKRAVTARRFVK